MPLAVILRTAWYRARFGPQYEHQRWDVSNDPGTLYIVATPIGNLEDLTRRAERVLREVDVVAAEDTRRARGLLQHYGISARLVSFHDHNEERQLTALLDRLERGEALAVISDAGTPLISDPGYRLVREARRRELPVVTVPGPSSVIAALSIAGLPTDRFTFEGFLAAKPKARREQLDMLRNEPRTVVCFESAHRIVASLSDIVEVLGPEREVCVARELTKTFETVRTGPVGELLSWIAAAPERQKGEFVVMIAAAPPAPDAASNQAEAVLRTLLDELPLKQAASLAARLTGAPRNELYRRALDMTRE